MQESASQPPFHRVARKHLVCPLLLLLCFCENTSAASLCEGKTFNPHVYGDIAFFTYSDAKSERLTKLVACAQNAQTSPDIWIHWYIPRLESWVPPGEEVPVVRYARPAAKPLARPLLGCLEYGPSAENLSFTRAAFLGTEDDIPLVNRETCLRKADSRRTPEVTPWTDKERFLGGLSSTVKLFIPSDLSKPKDSMLSLQGQFLLKSLEGDKYKAIFQYTLERYREREGGDPSSVRLRPVFSKGSSELADNFKKLNGIDLVKLSASGSVVFEGKITNNSGITSITYEFVNKQNQVLGAFDVPAIVRVVR